MNYLLFYWLLLFNSLCLCYVHLTLPTWIYVVSLRILTAWILCYHSITERKRKIILVEVFSWVLRQCAELKTNSIRRVNCKGQGSLNFASISKEKLSFQMSSDYEVENEQENAVGKEKEKEIAEVTKDSSAKKRKCKFQANWLKDLKFSSWLQQHPIDCYTAHCTLCKSKIDKISVFITLLSFLENITIFVIIIFHW